MNLSSVASVCLVAALLTAGCSSKTSTSSTPKPATGQAAAKTTKKPASTPPPTTKASTTVSANQSNATTTEETCTAADEGLGACIEQFAVFCAGGTLWALDCEAAFGGTCGEVDGALDCLVPESDAE